MDVRMYVVLLYIFCFLILALLLSNDLIVCTKFSIVYLREAAKQCLPVDTIFGGIQVSTTICRECYTVSIVLIYVHIVTPTYINVYLTCMDYL